MQRKFLKWVLLAIVMAALLIGGGIAYSIVSKPHAPEAPAYTWTQADLTVTTGAPGPWLGDISGFSSEIGHLRELYALSKK